MVEEVKYTMVEGDNVPNLICDGYDEELEKKTAAKFEAWDKVIESNLMESEKQEDIGYVYSLLDDPTIYTYAFFRIDGEPIKMLYYQDTVLNATHDRILVPSSNQSGKCLNEGERVFKYDIKSSSVCLEEIKSLMVGDSVISYENNKKVIGTVTWKSKPIQKECYELRTKSGKRIICSADHKFLTPDGWHSINSGLRKNTKKDKDLKLSKRKSMLLVPDKVNYFGNSDISVDKVKLLGYMMTDGYFGNNSQTPKFTNNSLKLLSEFESCVYNEFNITVKKYKKNEGFDYVASCGRCGVNSNPFSDYLKELGIWINKSVRCLPKDLFNWKKEHIALFINRCFSGDGTLFKFIDKGKDNYRICFYSPCQKFIDELRDVLLFFGIHSSLVIEKPTKKSKATRNGYRLVISNKLDMKNFLEQIGFIYSKEKISEEIYNFVKDTDYHVIRDKYRVGEFFWDFIINVESVGIKTCYDITVENTHNFLCNGIVTHNSFSLCIKALTFAIKNPGKTVLLVSKSLFQAKDLPKQMRDLLKMSTLDTNSMLGDVSTKTEIYFKHYDEEGKELLDSRIICAPATDSALGFPVDLLLLDEIGFYSEPDGEHFWFQVAQPRLYRTKGQAIAYSNPNGKNNIVYTMWLSKQFHKYRFTFLDNPMNTKEEFDKLCEEMPKAQQESTLMAKFSSSAGSYFSSEEISLMQEERSNIMLPPSEVTEPFWIGFDFAKVNDRTVMMTGIPTKDGGVNIQSMYEYPQGTGYDIIIDDLKNIIERYGTSNIAGVGYDSTGVGKGIEDFMKIVENMGVMLTPVNFTIGSKSEMATLVKLLVEKNLREPEKESGLKVPKDAEFAKQMNKLIFKRTNSGQLQVHHEKESDRDDYFDSLMVITSCIMNFSNVPVSMEVIGKDVKQLMNDDNRCECGNIMDIGETFCTFCGKDYESWVI